MDREAWRAAIHGIAKSWTRLSNWTELSWWLIHVEVWQKTTKFCKAIILQFKNKQILKKERERNPKEGGTQEELPWTENVERQPQCLFHAPSSSPLWTWRNGSRGQTAEKGRAWVIPTWHPSWYCPPKPGMMDACWDLAKQTTVAMLFWGRWVSSLKKKLILK